MKISNTQQSLSDYLKNTEVLTNPQKFLGPNWETVLRWWLYYESLTDGHRDELVRRYWAIDLDTRNRARNLARNAAIEVISEDNRLAVWFVAQYLGALTCELISMHLLFERGHSLTFVPLIKDLSKESRFKKLKKKINKLVKSLWLFMKFGY
jgi:hypothetical protein